ncbi:MAG: NmrA family NAD(P)-binding protein, partial [Bacteroidia bacterium]|nr:NmrA family NAD(P)-binding protein [Bacteroidia bacterium]
SSFYSPQPSSPVVVFGGTGYYGRSVVQKLIAKGKPVRVVSRDRAKALSNHETFCGSHPVMQFSPCLYPNHPP